MTRPSNAATAIASLVTEREFVAQLMELASIRGYRTIWHRPAMRRDGRWVTATSGTGARGEPDVFAYKPGGRHLWIEAKAEDGRLSPDQKETIALMREAGCEVHVLRPSQLAEAAEILR